MVEEKLVRLEFDPLSSRRSDGKDRYSRTLAYVFLQDGTHLNASELGYYLVPHGRISATCNVALFPGLNGFFQGRFGTAVQPPKMEKDFVD